MTLPSTPQDSSPLLSLPPELLQHLLLFLPLSSLLALSLVSRSFHTLISTHSLPTFLRLLSYSPTPFQPHQQTWSLPAQARWADDVLSNFDSRDSMARGFGAWERKCMPVLKVWERGAGVARLVVGRGAELDLYDLGPRRRPTLLPMLPFLPPSQSASSGQMDITGVALDPSTPEELIISRVSGVVQRLRVEEPEWMGDCWRVGRLVEVGRYPVGSVGWEEQPWTVQALHSSSTLLGAALTSRPRPTFRGSHPSPFTTATTTTSTPITFSTLHSLPPPPTSHHLSLTSLSTPSTAPFLLPLPSKPWSLDLTATYLALGSSSPTPLTVYQLDSTGLPSSSPLSLTPPDEAGSAVYSLTTPPPHSTTLHPTQSLIAAFYDSTTRIYDLRSGSGGGAEVMRLADPWSEDPSYSVTCGGPSGGWVATGASREGMVRLWDVRSAGAPFSSSDGAGATFFPPSPSPSPSATYRQPPPVRSPIYSLALTYSSLYAVTDLQAFSLSFERPSSSPFPSEGEGEGTRYVMHEGEAGRGQLRVGWEEREREREKEGGRKVDARTRGRARMVDRW